VSDVSGVDESERERKERERKERERGFLMSSIQAGAVGTDLRHVLLGR
jgi:hypothetical protein